LLDLAGVAHVTSESGGRPSGFKDRSDPGFRLFRLDIQDGDGNAHPSERFSHGAAQLSASSSDGGDLSVQIKLLEDLVIVLACSSCRA
jgi:hypothetical protein